VKIVQSVQSFGKEYLSDVSFTNKGQGKTKAKKQGLENNRERTRVVGEGGEVEDIPGSESCIKRGARWAGPNVSQVTRSVGAKGENQGVDQIKVNRLKKKPDSSGRRRERETVGRGKNRGNYCGSSTDLSQKGKKKGETITKERGNS